MAQFPGQIDALEEAERRGLLSPEQKAALNEARRRGLVPRNAGAQTRIPGPSPAVPDAPPVEMQPAQPIQQPPPPAPPGRDVPGWAHRAGPRFDPTPTMRQRILQQEEPFDAATEQSPGPVPTTARQRANEGRRRVIEERPEYLKDAVKNLLPSLGQLGIDISAPIHSPVKTASGLWALISDIPKLMPGGESPENLKAVGNYMKERWSDPLKSFSEDPAGMISDVAGIFLGGSTLALKAAGQTGRLAKVAQAANTAGHALDLPTHMARGAGAALRPVGNAIAGAANRARPALTAGMGAATGASPRAFEAGLEAGLTRGDKGREMRADFSAYRRRQRPLDDLTEDVRNAVKSRQEGLDARSDEIANAFGFNDNPAGKPNPYYYGDKVSTMERIKNFDPFNPEVSNELLADWAEFQRGKRGEFDDYAPEEVGREYAKMGPLRPDQHMKAAAAVDRQVPRPTGGWEDISARQAAPGQPATGATGEPIRGQGPVRQRPTPKAEFEKGARNPAYWDPAVPGTDWNRDLEWEIYAPDRVPDKVSQQGVTQAEYSSEPRFHKHRVFYNKKREGNPPLEKMLADARKVLDERRRAGFDHPGNEMLEKFIAANEGRVRADAPTPDAPTPTPEPAKPRILREKLKVDPQQLYMKEALAQGLDPKSKEFRDFAIQSSLYPRDKIIGERTAKEFWRRARLYSSAKSTELEQNMPVFAAKLKAERKRVDAKDARAAKNRASRESTEHEGYDYYKPDETSIPDSVRQHAARLKATLREAASDLSGEGDITAAKRAVKRGMGVADDPNAPGSTTVRRRLDQPLPVEDARRIAGHKVDVDKLGLNTLEATFRDVAAGIDMDPSSRGWRNDVVKVLERTALLPPDRRNVAGAHAMWKRLKNLESAKRTRSGGPPKVISRAREAFEKELRRQAPDEYWHLMDQIDKEHRQVSNIGSALSAYNRTPDEMTLGKLENLWPKGANQGRRARYREQLGDSLGMKNFDQKLAGMLLDTWTPKRGGHKAGLGALSTAAGIGGAMVNPLLLMAPALMSPRGMGAVSQRVGSGIRLGGNVGGAVFNRKNAMPAYLASTLSGEGDQQSMLDLLANLLR